MNAQQLHKCNIDLPSVTEFKDPHLEIMHAVANLETKQIGKARTVEDFTV